MSVSSSPYRNSLSSFPSSKKFPDAELESKSDRDRVTSNKDSTSPPENQRNTDGDTKSSTSSITSNRTVASHDSLVTASTDSSSSSDLPKRSETPRMAISSDDRGRSSLPITSSVTYKPKGNESVQHGTRERIFQARAYDTATSDNSFVRPSITSYSGGLSSYARASTTNFSNLGYKEMDDGTTTTAGDQASSSVAKHSSTTLCHETDENSYAPRRKGRSSSRGASARVRSKTASITPNNPRYSDCRSSRTTSSITPQSSTRFKVVAVVEGRGVARGEIGMAYIDLKNSVLVLSQFADTQAYLRLAVQLDVLRPIEIILPHTVMEARSKIITRIREMFPEILTVTLLRKYFNETKGLQCIKDLCVPEYSTVEIEVSSKYYCLAACAALLKYVEFKQNMTYASRSLRFVFRTTEDTALINTSTARHLELVTNNVGKIEHSLYGVLNHTLTPGGDRLLRANILQPPCDIHTINTRLDCVSELMENEDLFNDLKSVIGKFMETEHVLSLCIQIPKEKGIRNSEQKISNVICLKQSLDLVKPLHSCLGKANNALFQAYHQALSDERFQELQDKLSCVIHSDAKYQKGTLTMSMQKCFAVRPNINGLLDVARRAYTESVNDISELMKQLEKEYNLPLNIGYSAVRGFYIQVLGKSMTSVGQLPSVFLKVNKEKNSITCTTDDLIKLNDRIRESLNEIYLMSDIIIDEVLNEIREHMGCLYSLTEAVSSIDFHLSLAHTCTLSDHVRPEFSNHMLAIKRGRHPVVEAIIGPPYMPNDTFLCDHQNFIVLSGANMSGKTTYLKQVAIFQIMAQIGCYVPAEFASIRIADQILTRMGSSGDIEKNYSSFMLQMKEANFILRNATEKSLIIMDELGKGTNAEEGCAVAFAICEELQMSKAFTICSTHFEPLTKLANVFPNVENYHFRVDYNLKENEGSVCNMSHICELGACKDKIYGIKVAELSALPPTVVEEAKKIAEAMSASERNEIQRTLIDEAMKEKIKVAIHLIHVSEMDWPDPKELQEHLRDIKAQIIGSSPETPSSVSRAT